MNLQTTKQINIDVSEYKYISLNAKQYDRNLRYILVTCYRNGELLSIKNNDTSSYFASIRYRKPDGNAVFNTCQITESGKILIELTEQMLAVAGWCYADVVIHESVNLSVNIVENADRTVDITDTGESGILSTMTFAVYVHEAAFDNREVESSYEYNALNDLLTEARRNYDAVIDSCNESKIAAAASAETAIENAEIATDKATLASNAADAAHNKMLIASEKANIATEKATIAEDSAKIAQSYATGDIGYRSGEETDNAKYYYEGSLENASDADEARNIAQSYAVGGTGTRENEDTANAQFFYEQIKRVNDGITGGLIPAGTIEFSELTTVEKEVGYMYNISTDFTTDDTFREGAGNTYEAGTLVYYTTEGKWDCLVGTTISIANVDEVMEYLGI